MMDNNAIIKIADVLTAEDFYKGTHQKIFESMMELYAKNEPIDILSLSARLKEKNELEGIGGVSYLTSLVNSVPTAAHIVHYGKIVKKKSTLRNLISASYEIQNLSYQETEDVEEILDKAEKRIFSISQKSIGHQFSPVKDVLPEVISRLEKLQKGDTSLRGLPTGFEGLNSYLGGLQKSDFIILAARPSLGKTALALDIARHAAIREGIPVGIFSLEMSREQLTERLIAAESRVDLWRLRTGRLQNEKEDRESIENASVKLARAPLFIDDSAMPSVVEMRAISRRLQAERGLGLLIIDYIQMILPRSSYESSVQQMTEISRLLKAMAKELNIPLLAISQLSRAPEHRTPDQRRPRLSDLRESGALEQDA
ncbi:MAG: replicative DNA helicase, partial [bacterium]|nr:replicative DNA helicase [bacterium]